MDKPYICPYKDEIISTAKDVAELKGLIFSYHRTIKACVVILAAYLGLDLSGLT